MAMTDKPYQLIQTLYNKANYELKTNLAFMAFVSIFHNLFLQ